MKKKIIFFILTFMCFNVSSYELPITIIVPSYNNAAWYQKNLNSIFSQQYKNYRVIYLDDNSSDNTGLLVEQYIKKNSQKHRVNLIKNRQRQRQLANHYKAVHMCDDWDIIVNLDGDDWFAHPLVLQKINKVYQDPNVWITWGQFKHWPNPKIGGCKAMPRTYNIRTEAWISSHLRTFYAWLFKKIDVHDLLDPSGEFFYAAADFAIMMPMLEMAGPKHRQFIPHILYIYNRANALNVNKINKEKVQNCSKLIRSKNPYKELQIIKKNPHIK